MKHVMLGLLGFAALVVMFGCGSKEGPKSTAKSEPRKSVSANKKQDKQTSVKASSAKSIAVADPNKVFNDYLKSRSVGYSFQGEIRSAFIRLSEDGRKAVAAEMQNLIAE